MGSSPTWFHFFSVKFNRCWREKILLIKINCLINILPQADSISHTFWHLLNFLKENARAHPMAGWWHTLLADKQGRLLWGQCHYYVPWPADRCPVVHSSRVNSALAGHLIWEQKETPQSYILLVYHFFFHFHIRNRKWYRYLHLKTNISVNASINICNSHTKYIHTKTNVLIITYYSNSKFIIVIT